MMHLTCTNMPVAKLDEALKEVSSTPIPIWPGANTCHLIGSLLPHQ